MTLYTSSPFSEAVGWGIFPAVMAETEDMPSPDEREDTLERARFRSDLDSVSMWALPLFTSIVP